ncbi:hypothetical protein AGRA3207_005207 [Actinomadura graeca]|uniref:Sulfotransferase family protein n=1 Tax=Actinomadura graeca TaxID=2750812 RepID=A0ABX8QYU7_9ACTN|nr:hypothetical protein [Actinomadura graeca]QXJ23970.1 hypothetical protein AGRA3207_005207 [Actinomadura graeca]
MVSPHSGRTAQNARPAVYLHVGAAKSGTTYLQQVLWHNRDRLRGHGVLYPGADQADHVRAAFDLRGTFFRGASDPSVPGSWRDIVERVREWPGDAIISQELFAPATAAQVARAMDDLSFADVHVVFTARDLARQIPAHWQEDVKNRFSTPFAEFVAVLRRTDWRSFDSARLFWGLQDPVAVLGRWGAALPPERVHVVTLPRPGAPRDLLWRRFCAAVGLVPDEYDLSRSFANPSLGLAETGFLLRLNTALDEGVGWQVYNESVKHHLAQEVLAARPAPVRIGLPPDGLRWATERAVETAEGLRAAGYHVVGDLYELVPAAGAADVPAAEASPAELADVGTDAVAALLLRVLDAERRAASTPGSQMAPGDRLGLLRDDSAELLELTGRLVRDATPLVHRAVHSATERYPAVRRVQGAYRRLHDKAGRSDAGTSKG